MYRCTLRWLFAMMVGLGVGLPSGAGASEPTAKKIVFLAGKKSHGPGAHEYEKDVKLLKHCLDTSPNVKGVKTEAHFNGWPADPATLDTADTIVLLSDGLDKQYPIDQHPLLKGDHLAVIERQLQRGCGLVVIHWPLWVPGKIGQAKLMPRLGGFCDYENPPAPGMSDRVDWSRQSEHPICRGLAPFTFQDEYYGNVRFQGTDPRFTPILPFPGKPKQPVWAWAWQRDGGDRSFAFIGGHSHANWQIDMLRKAILNAILWTAKADIPAGGAASTVDAGPAAASPNPQDNWPAYNELCRRVWIDGRSSHDAFGPFRVEITAVKHPITAGLKAFDTVDELYFNQQGSLPIEPLATARSKLTGKDEPMAFAYPLGKGRVFQPEGPFAWFP